MPLVEFEPTTPVFERMIFHALDRKTTVIGPYSPYPLIILSRVRVGADGVCLEIGFINLFNIRLVTTSNYSAIANLHTL
jgi:hypothetical protein